MRDFRDYRDCLERQGLKPSHVVLVADLGEKILHQYREQRPVGELPFSLSEAPPSCREGSLGTPWGLHVVCEKYGGGDPAGTVFTGRRATGQTWWQREDAGPLQKNLVTTRILRLRGLEPGLNAGPGRDSYDRYIYIHGTNHPERFPENLSSGCLLMRDEDLVAIYPQVATGTHLWIPEPGKGQFARKEFARGILPESGMEGIH